MSKQYLDKDGLTVVANKTEKKFRYDAMPPAGSSFEGKIIQYVGTTTPNYKQGFFYTAVEDGGNWSWEVVNVSEGLEHWIGTQAEYEAQKENIPDGAIIALTDEIDTTYECGRYSTDEVVTGQRWIDNKPIYRKVINFGALPNANEKLVAHGISDIDTVIYVNGVSIWDKGSGAFNTMPINYINPILIENSVGLYVNETNVSIKTTSDLSIYTRTYIFLEYTKTTD